MVINSVIVCGVELPVLGPIALIICACMYAGLLGTICLLAFKCTIADPTDREVKSELTAKAQN
jgi:hypothetical protein